MSRRKDTKTERQKKKQTKQKQTKQNKTKQNKTKQTNKQTTTTTTAATATTATTTTATTSITTTTATTTTTTTITTTTTTTKTTTTTTTTTNQFRLHSCRSVSHFLGDRPHVTAFLRKDGCLLALRRDLLGLVEVRPILSFDSGPNLPHHVAIVPYLACITSASIYIVRVLSQTARRLYMSPHRELTWVVFHALGVLVQVEHAVCEGIEEIRVVRNNNRGLIAVFEEASQVRFALYQCTPQQRTIDFSLLISWFRFCFLSPVYLSCLWARQVAADQAPQSRPTPKAGVPVGLPKRN